MMVEKVSTPSKPEECSLHCVWFAGSTRRTGKFLAINLEVVPHTEVADYKEAREARSLAATRRKKK